MPVWGLWSILSWKFVLPGCEWVIRCISVQFHDELTSAYLQRASKVPLTIVLPSFVSPLPPAMHPSGTKDLRAYPRTRFQKTEVEFQEKIFMVRRAPMTRDRQVGQLVLRSHLTKMPSSFSWAASDYPSLTCRGELLALGILLWLLSATISTSRSHPFLFPSVWILRVARGDTQRQIRPGPTSAPTTSALFAASNDFDRTLMPAVVGLGRGRTSTCSMTSFATHGTVTELDLQRRIRLFP